VIIGDKKTGFVKKSLTRSVGEEIVRQASCDVLVVHGWQYAHVGRGPRRRAYSLNHAIWGFVASRRIRNLPSCLGCAERVTLSSLFE
jgi:hypothetical protein